MGLPSRDVLAPIIERHMRAVYPEHFDHVKDLAAQVAGASHSRGFPPHDFRTILQKSRRFIAKPPELRAFLKLVTADMNLAHVLLQAPADALPERFSQFLNERERAKLIAKTVLHRIGVPQEHWPRVETHGSWLNAGRELARLLASGNYLSQPLVRSLLTDSFHGRHLGTYSSMDENRRTRQDLIDLGVAHYIWFEEPFERHYDAEFQLQPGRSEGTLEALAQFYSLVRQANGLRRTIGFDARKLKAVFNRHTGWSVAEDEMLALIERANRHFEEHPGADCESKLKLSHETMSGILLELVELSQRRLHRLQEQKEQNRALESLEQSLVALQRVVAPHDTGISLREKSPRPRSPMTYVIRKQDKDPVTFLTGGNDTGVCDSTADRQAHRRPFLAIKYGYQEAALYKAHRSGQPRRFGQLRMYAAKDKAGRPVMIVNSVDLEAEERTNLRLYRVAIDYAREFAAACGFTRLLIGRHPDMAIVPFEGHELFSDLRPVEEHVELLDHFSPDKGFQDIFGGERNYGQKAGLARFYELGKHGRE